MTTPAWRRYLTFWRPNIESDVNDELRFHLEMRVNEYVARGMSPADARRLALESRQSEWNARAAKARRADSRTAVPQRLR